MRIEAKARYIAEEELLRARIQKATRAKLRKHQVFKPGDVVFAWREGHEKKSKLTQGAWYGPSVVLGTETATDAEGIPRPGSVR
jgi:hypothetical protein